MRPTKDFNESQFIKNDNSNCGSFLFLFCDTYADHQLSCHGCATVMVFVVALKLNKENARRERVNTSERRETAIKQTSRIEGCCFGFQRPGVCACVWCVRGCGIGPAGMGSSTTLLLFMFGMKQLSEHRARQVDEGFPMRFKFYSNKQCKRIYIKSNWGDCVERVPRCLIFLFKIYYLFFLSIYLWLLSKYTQVWAGWFCSISMFIFIVCCVKQPNERSEEVYLSNPFGVTSIFALFLKFNIEYSKSCRSENMLAKMRHDIWKQPEIYFQAKIFWQMKYIQDRPYVSVRLRAENQPH